MSTDTEKTLFDPLRRSHVKATPEEKVRQHWIRRLVNELGFPKEWLVVEKQIKQLPHLAGMSSLPSRRVDLLCYTQGLHPLLLIECKADALNLSALDQIAGYNYHVKASCVAVVNQEEVWLRDLRQQTLSYIPTFEELIAWVRVP